MPTPKFIDITISALTSHENHIREIHNWLEKWGPLLQRCLEWGGYREEIYEVTAPAEAIEELSKELWVEGRQISQPGGGTSTKLVANDS